jgi:hypothetical protein
MDPENAYYTAPQPQAPPSRKRLVIAIVIIALALLLIAIVVILAITSRTANNAQVDDPKYRLHGTDLTTDKNFSMLQGNDFYSFDGLAFYKKNLDSGKVTILRSGVKLPTPQSITWAGDNGALMVFSSGFGGTKVTDTTGFYVDKSESQYVWYLDFASGQLKLVDQLPMVGNSAYYSAASHSIYYLTNPASTVATDKHPLVAYDVQTGKRSQLMSDIGAADAESLFGCQSDMKACFIAGSPMQLYGINQANQKVSLFNSKGRLFTTNKPELYVFVPTSNGNQDAKIDEDVDYDPAPAQLYNLKTKQTSQLGFDVDQAEPLVHFVSDSNFYVFSSDYNTGNANDQYADLKPGYRSGSIQTGATGKSKVFPLLYQSGDKQFSSQIIAISHGAEASLVADATLHQLLFTDKTSLNLNSANQSTVTSAIKACLANGAKSYTTIDNYNYRIEFIYDGNFANNIATFSSCLAQKNGTLVGYNYSFAGVDASSRLLTD